LGIFTHILSGVIKFLVLKATFDSEVEGLVLDTIDFAIITENGSKFLEQESLHHEAHVKRFDLN
jgi:hypothetical protein